MDGNLTSSSRIHGTFGEILQGYVLSPRGYEHFLYTAPVEELFSYARVSPVQHSRQSASITPSGRELALAAFTRMACELGASPAGHAIEIISNIPVARGHASSTSDILASAEACLHHFYPDTPAPVARALILSVARELERGDYLLHPGVTSCCQLSHRLITEYKTDLRWTIVGVDEGGTVETEKFHQQTTEIPAKADIYQRLFAELDQALRSGHYARCAEIATKSAELHDDVLPKGSLVDLTKTQAETGALGICVAHSGTLAGLIFSRHQSEFRERILECRKILASLRYQSSIYTLKEVSPT